MVVFQLFRYWKKQRHAQSLPLKQFEFLKNPRVGSLPKWKAKAYDPITHCQSRCSWI